nr:hypothetical protein CFP56_33726 [Quercus suber]
MPKEQLLRDVVQRDLLVHSVYLVYLIYTKSLWHDELLTRPLSCLCKSQEIKKSHIDAPAHSRRTPICFVHLAGTGFNVQATPFF